jgi:hypothetical protein
MVMSQPTQDAPFLVDRDNASFLAGTGWAVPQRYGSGIFDLAIGGLVGGASLFLPLGIASLGINLDIVTIISIAGGIVGGVGFAAGSLRSGWRAVRSAHAYRTRAYRVDGRFTALELVEEEAGDWFLKGEYQFADETGSIHHGTFSKYRDDLLGKPLPPVGTHAVILVLSPGQHTVL